MFITAVNRFGQLFPNSRQFVSRRNNFFCLTGKNYDTIKVKGGENMEKDIANYVRRHTLLVTAVVTIAFLVLAAGEYYLYRKIMTVNRQVSEGTMQIQDAIRDLKPVPKR